MNQEQTDNDRGLECAIVKMALSAQEVELSPDDLPTMKRLTKTLQRCLRQTEIALEKKKFSRRSERATDRGAATAA